MTAPVPKKSPAPPDEGLTDLLSEIRLPVPVDPDVVLGLPVDALAFQLLRKFADGSALPHVFLRTRSSAPAFAQWHDPPQDGNGQPHDAGHNPGGQVAYHVGDHEVRG